MASVLIDSYSLVNLNTEIEILGMPFSILTARNVLKILTVAATASSEFNTGVWATIHTTQGIPMSYLFDERSCQFSYVWLAGSLLIPTFLYSIRR